MLVPLDVTNGKLYLVIAFLVLCQHRHCLVPEPITLKASLCPLSHSSQFLPNLNPYQTLTCPSLCRFSHCQSRTIWWVAFGFCHLSLRIMWGFSQVVVCIDTHSLLHGTLWSEHTTGCLSVSRRWVISVFWPPWMGLQWKSVYKFLFEHPFQLCHLYIRNVFIGLNGNSTFDLLGTIKLFYILFPSFHIHTDNVQEFHFLHVLANSGFLLYLT